MSLVTSAAVGALRFAEDEPAFNPDIVSPGVAGFLVTAFIALAVILLGTDLVRRLRRGRYREEIRRDLQAELDERAAAENPGARDASVDPGAPQSPAGPAVGEAGEPGDTADETGLGDPPRS